jgi:hypothetical protein
MDEAVREKYADRVEAIVASHIENFRNAVIARKAYRPPISKRSTSISSAAIPTADFGGIDQFFLWRPFRNSVNHRTPVARLHHIGASSHPGPGSAAARDFWWRKRWHEPPAGARAVVHGYPQRSEGHLEKPPERPAEAALQGEPPDKVPSPAKRFVKRDIGDYDGKAGNRILLFKFIFLPAASSTFKKSDIPCYSGRCENPKHVCSRPRPC